MESYIHLSSITSFPIVLVITRYPEILRIFRESFVSAALQLLFLINTPTDNSSHLPVIRSSPVVQVFRKIIRNAIGSSKILSSLLLLKFLLGCIMVNPISLVILLPSFVTIILSPLIQYVANARNPQSKLEFVLLAQTALRT